MLEDLATRLSRIQVGKLRYNSPWTQVLLVGLVCFCSVGMFSAVGGLGAGGTENAQLSDTANAVLYATFAIFGLVGGSINNILGPRLALSIGSCGYILYIGSLWNYQVHGTEWFVIFSGAILGVCAAILWAAQGAIMMSYPMEKDKGRSFSLFWIVFAMGSLMGSAIALGIEYHSTLPAVSTGVYLAFMIVQSVGIVFSWLILPPHLVIRGDGTVVNLEDSTGYKQEIKDFIQQFKTWNMLLLFPMFFSSNYFYSYQGAITAFLFNGRTRSLSALLTGVGAIVGALAIGVITDKSPGSRKRRAFTGLIVSSVAMVAVWAGGLAYQTKFKRGQDDFGAMDWTNHRAIGPIILILCCKSPIVQQWRYADRFTDYICDASYQGLAYYSMASITNSPFKLARMAGYYKGVQSAGGAIAWAMDAVKTPYLSELIISWVLLLFSIPLVAIVLYRVKESNYEDEHAVHVEDLPVGTLEHAALPGGHHEGTAGDKNQVITLDLEEKV